LASKYQLDSQTAIGVKVNNICQLGLSFQQLLRPGIYIYIHFYLNIFYKIFILGVKLTLSGLFEARNLNAGGHKVGLGLEIEN
jgi:hypothetical protein